MSAAVMLRQRDSIHLMVDAASYHNNGIVAGFLDKCVALPEMRCAVAVIGSMNWHFIVTEAICDSFVSFDEIKAGIPSLLEDLFEQHSDTVADAGRRIVGDVWCIGWSEERQGPDGFTIGIDSLDEFNERVAKGDSNARRPFQIDMLGPQGLNWHPHPTGDQLFEAKFPVSLLETNRLIAEVDLLQLLEVQRRIPFDKCAGAYCVGGYALLTTVDRYGATQRRIHEWPEDEGGALIKPGPINWVTWRADREARLAPAKVIPIFNRRQRRQQRAMSR
jgi:hypothetical protein